MKDEEESEGNKGGEENGTEVSVPDLLPCFRVRVEKRFSSAKHMKHMKHMKMAKNKKRKKDVQQ